MTLYSVNMGVAITYKIPNPQHMAIWRIATFWLALVLLAKRNRTRKS